jgi:hypothetical protein
MACFNPIHGFKGENGQFTQNKARSNSGIPLTIPCRKCIGCRLDHAQEWATRLVHELQYHDKAMFITLTYNPENYERINGSLELRDWQLFMKKLRKRFAPQRVQFYMAGEYGKIDMMTGLSKPNHEKVTAVPFTPTIGRPHFHAIIFGVEYDDLVEKFVNKHKQGVYTSKKLESDWGNGFASIGKVTLHSCGYVARYVTKKITGDLANDHYTRKKVDENGVLLESIPVTPEFSTMSRGNRLRPENGIGYRWIKEFFSDVFPHDRVVLQRPGQQPKIVKVPRYYDYLLEKSDPELLERVKKARRKKASRSAKDNTPERLRQKLHCKEKQTEVLTRGYLYD